MSVKGGPKIVSDGLVFNLDAAGAVSDKGYPINGLIVEYLIVAGGGGGGGVIGGGGGAGGLLHGYTRASLSTGSYTVTVGAGGAGGTGWNTSSQDGKIGGNSSVFSITSTGGGGGVHHGGATTSTNKNGGSGGGGANGSYDGGAGINTQGNNGGNNGNGNLGAGGGGAGSVGGNASGSYGGSGGLGKYYGYSFGASVGYDGWFADGGAGGVRGYAGTFVRTATHGGGSGTSTTTTAGNGSTNTGSGGGGGGYNASSSSRIGGNGGSGVVIIRYKGSQKASGGDSIFNYKGFTVHVFTSSGTFTVGDRVGGLSTSKIVGNLNNMGPSDYSTGNKGYFSFDGTNQSITFNHPTGQSDGVTHEILIRLNETTQNGILTFNNGGSVLSGLSIVANRFIIYLSGSNYSYFWGFPTLSTGIWYHVVFYLGSGNAADAKGYVDGVLATTIPTNHTGTAYSPTTMYVASTTNTSYLYCDVAFVRCYNRELLIEEIQDNYNATKGRFGL